jgi:hypothetical protein
MYTKLPAMECDVTELDEHSQVELDRFIINNAEHDFSGHRLHMYDGETVDHPFLECPDCMETPSHVKYGLCTCVALDTLKGGVTWYWLDSINHACQPDTQRTRC